MAHKTRHEQKAMGTARKDPRKLAKKSKVHAVKKAYKRSEIGTAHMWARGYDHAD